jgi:2,4-dichlorophenol 6-monooxygenase
VGRGAARLSTLDLGGQGRFTLLTGIGGEAWVTAATEVGARLGVALTGVRIGPGADYEDLYGDWAALREVADSGCVLMRPDNYVCFRRQTLDGDAVATLEEAMRRILAV